eukprot:1224274-Prymnesium_polylepis.1
MLRNYRDGTTMALQYVTVNASSKWTQYKFRLVTSASAGDATCEGIAEGSDPNVNCHVSRDRPVAEPLNRRQGHVCIRCAGEVRCRNSNRGWRH